MDWMHTVFHGLLLLLVIFEYSKADLVLRRYRKPKEKGFVLGRHSSGFIDVPQKSYLIVAGSVNIGNFSYIKLHEDGALLVAIDANVDVGRYFSAYALEGALVLHKNSTFYTGAWNQLRVTHNKTLRLEQEASVRAPSAFIYTYINDNVVVGSQAHITLEQSSRFIVSSCSAGNFISCRFGTGSRVSIDVAGELSIGGAFRIHGTGNVMIGYHGLIHTAANSSVLMRPLTQLRLGQFSVLNLRPGASIVINVQGASLELGDHARLVIEDDVQCEIRGLINVDSSVSAGWVHGSGTANSAFQCLKKGEKVRPEVIDDQLSIPIVDDPAAIINHGDQDEGSFGRIFSSESSDVPRAIRGRQKTINDLESVEVPVHQTFSTRRGANKRVTDLQPLVYESSNARTQTQRQLRSSDLQPIEYAQRKRLRSSDLEPLEAIRTSELFESNPSYSTFGNNPLNSFTRGQSRSVPTSPKSFNLQVHRQPSEARLNSPNLVSREIYHYPNQVRQQRTRHQPTHSNTASSNTYPRQFRSSDLQPIQRTSSWNAFV